jgi:hypothetical protein
MPANNLQAVLQAARLDRVGIIVTRIGLVVVVAADRPDR